jgi:hypothetical protein
VNNHNFSRNCGLYAFRAFWDALTAWQIIAHAAAKDEKEKG